MSTYWREAIECALDEAGLSATTEQLDAMTKVVEGAHDFYGQAHGHDVAFRSEPAAKPKRKLRKPYCVGSSYCMADGSTDETWTITDESSGDTFGFSGPSAALRARQFYEQNQ